jgi:hypothetical protein
LFAVFLTIVIGGAFSKERDRTGLYSINRPNAWPVNAELDFGGGLFGKRIAGVINARANEDSRQIIVSGAGLRLVAYGGAVGMQDASGWLMVVGGMFM